MALADRVKARYSTVRLKELTNQDDQAATVIDDTVLGHAVTDVGADFLIHAGLAYDDTVATHVVVAVEGVYAKLSIRTDAAGADADKKHDAYLERLKALHLITASDRIVPETKSEFYPSDENPDNDVTLRPPMDDEHFDDLIPNPPD